MSEIKRAFACEYCLDRGWVIEQSFSPALESRAEMVPCPCCRPTQPEPSAAERRVVSLLFVAVLLALLLLV